MPGSFTSSKQGFVRGIMEAGEVARNRDRTGLAFPPRDCLEDWRVAIHLEELSGAQAARGHKADLMRAFATTGQTSTPARNHQELQTIFSGPGAGSRLGPTEEDSGHQAVAVGKASQPGAPSGSPGRNLTSEALAPRTTASGETAVA